MKSSKDGGSHQGVEDGKGEKNAALPVILVTILVVVLIIVPIFIFFSTPKTGCACASSIQFVCEKVGPTNWTMQMAANEINPNDLKYAVVSQTQNWTLAIPATDFPRTSNISDENGVTWIDTDGNGKVNTGDVLTIDNPIISSGDYFRIIAGATGEIELP